MPFSSRWGVVGPAWPGPDVNLGVCQACLRCNASFMVYIIIISCCIMLHYIIVSAPALLVFACFIIIDMHCTVLCYLRSVCIICCCVMMCSCVYHAMLLSMISIVIFVMFYVFFGFQFSMRYLYMNLFSFFVLITVPF